MVQTIPSNSMPPSSILQDIFTTGQVQDSAGTKYPLEANIMLPYTKSLYNTILCYRPAIVVEVGMAYGISSLAILAALRETGGRLISIDPNQDEDFHGIGVTNVEREGLADRHELIQQPDYFALPQLLKSGLTIDFAYIDGWHTFDYTLLDFFYIDKMVPKGGIVAFNDCGWRAVHKVLNFVRTHRQYKEINVGLARDYAGDNLAKTAVKRVTGRTNTDRYFQKLDTSEPNFDFYKYF